MDINLLPEETFEAIKKKKLYQKFSFFSVLGLIVTSLIAVGVFAFWFTLVSQEKNLTQKIKTTEGNITTYSQVEGLNLVYVKKAQGISQIVTERKDFEIFLNSLKGVLNKGISFDTLNVNEAGVVSISGTARTAVELGSFLEALIDPDAGGKFAKDISIANLANSDEGFDFSLNLTAII